MKAQKKSYDDDDGNDGNDGDDGDDDSPSLL